MIHCLWPQFIVRPLASLAVKGVSLPSRGLWITQISRLDLLRLDDNDTEVLSRYEVVDVLHLGSELEILVVIRF